MEFFLIHDCITLLGTMPNVSIFSFIEKCDRYDTYMFGSSRIFAAHMLVMDQCNMLDETYFSYRNKHSPNIDTSNQLTRKEDVIPNEKDPKPITILLVIL